MDHGDFVVVKNVEKIKFTGGNSKIKNIINILGILVVLKKLHHKNLSEKNKPEEILKLAVKECFLRGPLAKIN